MPSQVYRYTFSPDVDLAEVETLLVTAVESIEHLHGEAAARLDARYFLDEGGCRCVIDAASAIGIELNKLFAGALSRTFGQDAFRVERVYAEPSFVPA